MITLLWTLLFTFIIVKLVVNDFLGIRVLVAMGIKFLCGLTVLLLSWPILIVFAIVWRMK